MTNFYTESDDITTYWDRRHAEWLANPNWETFIEKYEWFNIRFDHLLPRKSDNPTGRVLDYGCGAGLYARPLSERYRSYTGFDTSPSAIKVAETYNKQFPELFQRILFHLHTGKPGTWETNVQDWYDLIISITVLQHQPIVYRLAMIENIKRLLKPGGLYIGLEMNDSATSAADMPPLARGEWIEAWKPLVITQDIPAEHPQWEADNVWTAR